MTVPQHKEGTVYRYLITLISLAIFQPSGWAQTPVDPSTPQPAGSPYELVPVADDQKVIEEKSLVFQSGVLGTVQSQSRPGSRPVGGNSDMTERTADMPNALRCYGFVLAARERLRLRLKGDTQGRIFMKFLPKKTADSMTSQVRRANMLPAPVRASKIEITNITDKPYQVALMLYGQANYPYILEIERTKNN